MKNNFKIALIVLPLFIAACNSQPVQRHSTKINPTTTTQVPTTTTQVPTTTTQVPTTTHTPTTTQAPTTTTQAPIASTSISRCLSPQLQVTNINGADIAMQTAEILQFKNLSSSTCSLYGVPGIGAVSTNGQPISGIYSVKNATLFPLACTNLLAPNPDITQSSVNLIPGGVAYFEVTVPQNAMTNPATGQPYPAISATFTKITPPGAYHYIKVANLGTYFSNENGLSTSPVFSATTWTTSGCPSSLLSPP